MTGFDWLAQQKIGTNKRVPTKIVSAMSFHLRYWRTKRVIRTRLVTDRPIWALGTHLWSATASSATSPPTFLILQNWTCLVILRLAEENGVVPVGPSNVEMAMLLFLTNCPTEPRLPWRFRDIIIHVSLVWQNFLIFWCYPTFVSSVWNG